MDRARLFMSVFRRFFVYNIVFEDSEVDQRVLGLDERSEVLSITGAGCGVAAMAAARPHRIDAVDINHHHLALTALKLQAAQRVNEYSDFYDLFGRGYTTHPATMLKAITKDLPPWIQKYWKKHHGRFHEPFFRQGMSGQVLTLLRRASNCSAEWLRRALPMTVEERHRYIDDTLAKALRRPHVKAFLKTPLHDVGIGVNKNQRERMLAASEQDSLVSFYIQHAKRVAETDLERNWIAWYTVAGHFNHDHPESLPPYLRRDRHAQSLDANVSARYHNDTMLSVMQRAGANTWSHYILSDAPDWMPERTQRSMLEEIRRTARPGALVLRRTVENDCMMERHGFGRFFERVNESSDFATRMERSRQYRRVDLYRLVS